MDIAAIVLVFVCIANFILGLSVLVRNPYARTGQSFFAMTLLIDSYAVANYLTDKSTRLSQSILFNKISYLAAFLSIVMAAVFTRYFVGGKSGYKTGTKILAAISVTAVSLLSVSRYVAGTVSYSGGKLTFDNGPLTTPYAILLIIILLAIIRTLYKLIEKGNAVQKNQSRIILLGFSASILIALITNAIIPAVSESNYQTARYGPPLLSLLLVTSISYAIAKHRLFDIRLVVARTLAYLLLLGTLVGIFVVFIFGATNIFFDNGTFNGLEKTVYIILAVAVGFLMQPLKVFFDRVTNRIFYRDAYDPQELLNDLNKYLITTIKLDQMLGKSARILSEAIKNDRVMFAIRQKDSEGMRFIGYSKRDADEIELLKLTSAVSRTRSRMIVADELPPKKEELKMIMQRSDISMAVKLQDSVNIHSQNPGYIFIGPKRSGGLYTAQDRAIIEIIADELVLAIQNALSYEEIQRFNATLQQKVDDATKQLRHANSRLKELDQTKDEFISMASHQLRTPLTTIKGYLSMVLEGDVGPVTKNEKQMIQQAFDSAERMVFLIGDLLNVSRLQSGKFVIDNKPTDLVKMVRTEVEQLKDTAEHHGLKLICNTPDKLPLFSLDETKIRQVVMNFMDNAIYYTPSGGSITVSLEATTDTISYKVVDTGLGVPKSEQHHLFTKFYRAGNARKMRPDGTGLGLFMAKKVIVAQGGAIIFKSEEGKGSTFGFSFPRHKIEIKGKPAAKPAPEAVAA